VDLIDRQLFTCEHLIAYTSQIKSTTRPNYEFMPLIYFEYVYVYKTSTVSLNLNVNLTEVKKRFGY